MEPVNLFVDALALEAQQRVNEAISPGLRNLVHAYAIDPQKMPQFQAFASDLSELLHRKPVL